MYFSLNFEFLGLERLTSTHFEREKPSYKLEMFRDTDGKIKTEQTSLEQNGDFRSPECINLLKQSDIVVTNEPFSLFREYVAQLFEYEKKFIIIGSLNAITYKETFSIIKNNRIWLGHTMPKEFLQPDGSVKKFGNIAWFTNLETKKRHESIILYRTYEGNEAEYPKYDNYDAINVDKVKDIPMDFQGIIGVPITFLDKYNPEQFEIIGITDRANTSGLRTKKYTLEEVPNFNDLNARGVIKIGSAYKAMYARLLIRNKKF